MAHPAKTLPPDTTLGPYILGFGWATTGICCIFTVMRFYSRWSKGTHGMDDYTIYVALLFLLACSIINILQVHYGFGRHIVYVLPFLQDLMMWTTLAEFFSSIAVALIKVSVCFFVLRFIQGTNKRMRFLLWGLIVCVSTTTTALSLVFLLQCRPFAKVWDKELEGTCMSTNVVTHVSRATSTFGAITDFICVLIPLFILKSLRIDTRTKVALGGVLALGFVTAGFSIAKTVLVQLSSDDLTYDLVAVLMCTMFEVNLGFIVACLPTLRPFLVLINSRLTTLRDLSFSRSGLRWRTIPTANQNSNRTTGSAYENIEFDTASRRSNANIIIKETTTQVEYGSQHSDLEAGSHIQDSWKPVG